MIKDLIEAELAIVTGSGDEGLPPITGIWDWLFPRPRPLPPGASGTES